MGREVRRVPANWQHPKEQKPDWRTERMVECYKPLFPGECYQPAVAGSHGNSFGLDAPGRQQLPEAVDVYLEILRASSPAQMEQATRLRLLALKGRSAANNL